MQNSTQFYNSYLENPDIFDFLDNVNEIKASQHENNSDTLEIVELYLDFFNESEAKLSRMSFDKQPCKASKINTLSRISTMSKGYEWQNEDYLEIYEERLAICQHDGNLSKDEAKKNAINDVEQQYLKQTQNSNNLKNFLIDFNDFIKSKTIQ